MLAHVFSRGATAVVLGILALLTIPSPSAAVANEYFIFPDPMRCPPTAGPDWDRLDTFICGNPDCFDCECPGGGARNVSPTSGARLTVTGFGPWSPPPGEAIMKVEFNVLARFPNATGNAELSYRVKLPFPPDVPLLAIDAPPFQNNDCFRYRVPSAFRVIADGNAPTNTGEYANAITFWSDPSFLNDLEIRIFKVNNQTDGDIVRIKTVRLKVTTAPDSDGDGWPDSRDACPSNPTKFVDSGTCGCEIDLPESACQDCNGNGISDDLDGFGFIVAADERRWDQSGGGSWNSSSNWCGPLGDNPVPGSNDVALFVDVPNASPITLSSNATAGGLVLDSSDLRLDAPGRVLRLLGGVGGDAVTLLNDSLLEVRGGTLRSDDGLNGGFGGGRVLVRSSDAFVEVANSGLSLPSRIILRNGGTFDIGAETLTSVTTPGQLEGNGVFRGNVTLSGPLSVGDTTGSSPRVGQLVIDGDLECVIQGRGALAGALIPKVRFDLQPGATPPSLAITGTATLVGLLDVRTFSSSVRAATTSSTILDSAGGFTGQFNVTYVDPALPDGQFVTIDYVDGPGASEQIVLGVASLGVNAQLGGPQAFSVSATPTDAVSADMNGDANEDLVLVIPSSSGGPGNLTILLADANGDYTSQITTLTSIDPQGVAVGDIDQSGGLDIAVTGCANNEVRVYSTDGAATPAISLERTLTTADIPSLNEPFDVVAGQLNGIGPDDFAFVSSGSDVLTILETMSDPMMLSFQFEPCDIPTKTRPKQLAYGAIDADLLADFVVTFGGSENGVSEVTSAGGYTRTDYNLPAEPGEVLVSDLDLDGLDDGFAVVPGADIAVFLRNVGAALTDPTELPVGENPTSVAEGDLDLDGDVEIATITGLPGSRVVQVLRNDTVTPGQLVLSQITPIDPGADPALVRTADSDGDGLPDLIALDASSGALRQDQSQGGVRLPNITPPPPCLPDITTSGSANGVPDGVVTLSDFSFYLTLWSNSDARADVTANGVCDPATAGDGVTLSDFSCYLTLWSQGCP